MATAKNTTTEKETTSFEWHLFDASSKPLGRLATEIASLLIGKHRSDFARNKVAPVQVVVINTDKLKLTGRKMEQKTYNWHTRYPGGIKTRTAADQLQRDSRVIVQQAVSGMLPKNNLRRERLVHLRLYKAAEHPHEAQVSSQSSQK